MSRHLFGLQEAFFTFSRARCLPLLARAWARSVHVRPQELVTRIGEDFATASPGWGWLQDAPSSFCSGTSPAP